MGYFLVMLLNAILFVTPSAIHSHFQSTIILSDSWQVLGTEHQPGIESTSRDLRFIVLSNFHS